MTETVASQDAEAPPRKPWRRRLIWLAAAVVIIVIVVLLWGDDTNLIDGHLDGPEAYLLVAALVFGDAIFPVLPGETAVNAATVLAAAGELSLGFVMLSAALGAVLGDSALFWIARLSHGPIRVRMDKAVDSKTGQSVIAMLTKYGPIFIVFGRYVPGLRFAINVTLGAVVHMPYRTFLFWSAISGTLWAVVTCLTAYFISSALDGYPLLSFLISTFLGTALIGSVIWLRSHLSKRHEAALAATD
jgi:membrane-associated protein